MKSIIGLVKVFLESCAVWAIFCNKETIKRSHTTVLYLLI